MFWGNKIDFIQSVEEQVLINDSLKKPHYSNLEDDQESEANFSRGNFLLKPVIL